MIPFNTQIFELPSSVGDMNVDFLFNKIYGSIPSKLAFADPLDAEKTSEFISKQFSPIFIKTVYRHKDSKEAGLWYGKGEYSDVIVEISGFRGSRDYIPDLMSSPNIAFGDSTKGDIKTCTVCAASKDNEKLKKLADVLKEFRHDTEAKIYLLVNNYGETDLQPLDVPQSETDVVLNYGPGFEKIHNDVINSLNNKKSGLYLFYGEPGTGKSSYIKHLLSTIKERRVVYIPVNLIDSLVSPNFLPILMNNKNMILVIEDAEKALLSREDNEGNSSLVSAILNLTDSFISSTLNVSIIATFNTKKEKLDTALLRKGRLKMSHEFGKLSVEESQNLIDHLKLDYTVKEPMTLAEIYYMDEDNRHKVEEKSDRVVGFGKA
jgi:hypothetical protein